MMAKERVKKEFYESAEVILKNARAIKRHIKILEETKLEVEEYKSRGIKSLATDGVRVSSSPGDSIGKQVVKISEMEEKIQKEMADEKKYLNLIKNGLASLSDEDRTIIEMRYFDNIPDSRISVMIGYERTNVYRKRVAAVRKIAIALYGKKCLES